MKTPKELLLSRHRDAEPALDAVREEALRELATKRRKPAAAIAQPAGASWLTTAWQELFVSCRRYWMGLGTAWCGILLVIEAVEEQLQMRAELLTGAPESELRPASAEPAPRSRSAIRSQLITV